MGRGRKRTSYSGPASNWPRARCTPASVQLGHAMLHSRLVCCECVIHMQCVVALPSFTCSAVPKCRTGSM